MRTRAYRPEVVGCLEGRLLLSGAAPYVLRSAQFKLFVVHVASAFTLYTRSRDLTQLRHDFDDVIPLIPFALADGLPAKIEGIVNEMRRDIHANVPHAIRTAANDVVAVTRAEVEARVRAGSVVVR